MATLAVLCNVSPAHADLDLKFSGLISSDIRYRLYGEPIPIAYPSQAQLPSHGFSRNDNDIKAKLTLSLSDKVKAVADTDLYLYGFSDLHDLDSTTLRPNIDPYRIEVNAAYLDIYKVLPGLDLRVGRQVVVWGAADQFNPTANINTLDFSDALLFGKALANNMVRADYNPKGDWVLTAVWVPVFRPAELPRTAPVALQQLDRPAPVQEGNPRDFFYNEQINPALAPTTVNVVTQVPDVSIQNSQLALRLAGRVLGQDVSLSYYHGRFGIPMPAQTVFHADRTADVGVVWPKEDVIGGDIAGTIERLAGLGYWIEGTVTFPEEITYALYQDRPDGKRNEFRFDPYNDMNVLFGNVVDMMGHYVSPMGQVQDSSGVRPTVVPTTPFLKLTAGADMTLGRHVYVNAQYVHGFVDEFGAGVAMHPLQNPANNCALPGNQVNGKGRPGCENPRIDQRLGDYIVAGMDLKLADDVVLVRLFGVVKLPSLDDTWHLESSWKPTGVLFPQLAWTVTDGTELSVGAFLFLGDRTTKFGDPAAGASEAFLRGKFTY